MPWKKTETGIVHFVSTTAGLWTEIVSQETQIEISQLLSWARFGCVYLNDSRILDECEVQPDDYLRIHTDPRRFPRIHLNDRVAFENEDLLIVNKPAGLPCHPTVDNLHENLWKDLESQFSLTLYPTHRLDVPTSGLVVLAKTSAAQLDFQNLLRDKKVQKIYQALVTTPGPELGLHEHYMQKSRYAPKTIWEQPRPQTQVCQLRILKKEILSSEKTRLEIELITGRTHQIRAQLAFLGYPVLDDHLYADFESRIQDEKIQLRCVYLKFPWHQQELEYRLPEPLS